MVCWQMLVSKKSALIIITTSLILFSLTTLMLRRREKLCREGKNPLRIKTLLRRLLLDPGLSTGHSAASAWPISAYYGYQL